MSFLRPLPMAKVAILGLKDDREIVISVLHDLHVMQVEPASKETLSVLEAEKADELQRTVGDQLIRLRGLVQALPPSPDGAPRRFANLAEILDAAKAIPIDAEVGELKREEEKLLTERSQLDETLALLARFAFFRDPYALLNTKSLLAFFGEGKPAVLPKVRAEIDRESPDQLYVESPEGDVVRFLIAVPTSRAESVGRIAQQSGIKLVPAPRLAGTAAEERPRLEARRAEIQQRLGAIGARLSEISKQWYPALLHAEEALLIESRKQEIHTKLGASARVFVLEGWIRRRDLPRLQQEMQVATQQRSYVYETPTDEEPPTVMENPPGVRWYEFFIRFYSLPMATEWDPTWTFALVFPILWGFMLGDVGYASVILLISVWMIAGFPGGGRLPRFLRAIPKVIMEPPAMRTLAFALVPGCLVGITMGVLTDAYFGFHLAYKPLIDPLSNTGLLLLISGYIGIALVVYGFFLGAIKELVHHKTRHALAKVGGIMATLGLSGLGLALLRQQLSLSSASVFVQNIAFLGPEAALLAVGVVLFFVGEGALGAMLGFIEVLSHVLSYTRIVGILLASVVLAQLIDVSVFGAGGLAYSASIAWIAIGIVLFLVVQVFNLILGVFEPSIQGMRLMFVEHFSKFYEGGGKPFHAFGSNRSHTESPYARPGGGP